MLQVLIEVKHTDRLKKDKNLSPQEAEEIYNNQGQVTDNLLWGTEEQGSKQLVVYVSDDQDLTRLEQFIIDFSMGWKILAANLGAEPILKYKENDVKKYVKGASIIFGKFQGHSVMEME